MTTTATDVMTSPAIVVASGASASEIAALLSSKHISAVPVCNAAGDLVGIVSEGDLLKPFTESTRVSRDWWLSLIAEGEALSDAFLDYIKEDARTAADLMVRHVVTAGEHATVPQLAELMMKNRVKRIPILRDARVVGIVSRADLINAIANVPATRI